MTEENQFNRIAKNPCDSYDLTGKLQDIPFLPIKVNQDFTSCICNGESKSQLFFCPFCHKKCHLSCYRLSHEQTNYFICINCQHKLVEAIMGQLNQSLENIQSSINSITNYFDELCEECKNISPTTFDSSVTVENSQILHSSIASFLGNASFRWSNTVTDLKKIHKLISFDLLSGYSKPQINTN